MTLAGVKSLTIHDNEAASWSDLSVQFFVSEEDLGRTRSEICESRLAELNPYPSYVYLLQLEIFVLFP